MKKTERRSMWDQPTPQPPSAPVSQPTPEALPPVPVPTAPIPIIDQIRVTEKKKRSRSWDEQNRATAFRGIPPEVQAQVKAVAKTLDVTVSEVARAFLEFSLESLRRGDLRLSSSFSQGKMMLYSNAAWGQSAAWSERPAGTLPPAPKKKNAKAVQALELEKPWRRPMVSYRHLPAGVLENIEELREQHSVPVGEVVSLLLRYALAAYEDGRLVLHPQPRRAAHLDIVS
ncbi:MAG TPA: hypothetical protein PKW33_11190 [Anaerolineaceae bacterium]|nr:hypothetical protein [Anaerolineaceae bacterium]HPN52144.1 hypothetical protein [Anaerolineaceae bacterium]